MLRVSSLGKSFGSTPALAEVSFEVGAGQVVGLVGENGAGKSTLIKLLSGIYQPDRGEMEWKGRPLRPRNGHEALHAGIATIHQELAAFDTLTVAENVMLDEAWPRFAWGGTDWKSLYAETERRLKACELTIDPRAMFHTLSPAQKQEVAIARALSKKAELLILDEPTAALTEPEVERLIGHLDRLKQTGVSILYVSHRLDEILRLTDRVMILRDGRLVAQYPTAQATIQRMVTDMVGRELQGFVKRMRPEPGAAVFECDRLTRAGLFEQITFQVRAGEIVGLSGLIGAGRSEIARAIFGLYRADSGTMRLNGRSYQPNSAAEARSAGVVYVPEERKRQGLVLQHSVRSGVSIGFLDSLTRFGMVRPGAERARVASAVERLRIKTRRVEDPVATLSGGNQQKALLGRWLEREPTLVILDEPTRGVDVRAKAEIHRLIEDLVARGKGVLLISSDMPELLALADRIVVLHKRKKAAEFTAADVTQEKILLAASGFTKEAG